MLGHDDLQFKSWLVCHGSYLKKRSDNPHPMRPCEAEIYGQGSHVASGSAAYFVALHEAEEYIPLSAVAMCIGGQAPVVLEPSPWGAVRMWMILGAPTSWEVRII